MAGPANVGLLGSDSNDASFTAPPLTLSNSEDIGSTVLPIERVSDATILKSFIFFNSVFLFQPIQKPVLLQILFLIMVED